MESKKRPAWQKTRKFLNDIHLWMGIGSGLILFVVCLSGTIYTFSTEIQEFVDKEKYFVKVPSHEERLPVEKVIAMVVDSLGGGQVQSVTIPANKESVYRLNIKKEEPKEDITENKEENPDRERNQTLDTASVPGIEKTRADSSKVQTKPQRAVTTSGPPQGGRGNRGTTYLVNPYSGTILGTTESTTSEFFMIMFRLHRWLLLDSSIGRPIVGWATVIFTLLVLTGLVIWIPKKVRAWKQGLKIMFSGNWKRVNHDLHNTLGFYSSFLLLIMALTGLTWSFDWYKDGFFKVLGVERPAPGAAREEIYSTIPTDPAPNPSVQEYLAQADELLPYQGDYRITLPSDETGTVSLIKSNVGFFAFSGTDRVQLDQYTAEPLKVELFSDKPLNEMITSSIKALHLGNIFGTFSKILYFIACLVATSLPITGTIIWINKLKKKKKKARKARDKKAKEDRKEGDYQLSQVGR